MAVLTWLMRDLVCLCMSYSEKIEVLIGAIETCEYKTQTFRDILDQIQKLIDDLNLRSYSNLIRWVAKLDEQVCHCLPLYFVANGYIFFGYWVWNPCLLHSVAKHLSG